MHAAYASTSGPAASGGGRRGGGPGGGWATRTNRSRGGGGRAGRPSHWHKRSSAYGPCRDASRTGGRRERGPSSGRGPQRRSVRSPVEASPRGGGRDRPPD